MFNPKNKAESGNGSLNTIGTGTTVKGDISSNGDLRIDGSIEGHLVSTSRIVIGAKASVVGNIHAANAIIEGKVTGNVEVSDVLSLKSTALIEGDIVMKKLVVETGAVFNGKSSMQPGPSKNVSKNESQQ